MSERNRPENVKQQPVDAPKEVKDNVVNARDLFLQARNNFKKSIVTFTDMNGHKVKVEMREPSGKQRGAIFQAATKLKKGGEAEIDHAEMQVWAMINCCYDVETGKPLFEAAHHDALLELPSSIFDKLAKPALELLGETPEESAKN